MGAERRVVNIKARITAEKVEAALAAAKDVVLENGEKPGRADIIATLIHSHALENLVVAEEILEGKDFDIDCDLIMLDPQAERSAKIRDRLRRELGQ